jgi:hypothetical protein
LCTSTGAGAGVDDVAGVAALDGLDRRGAARGCACVGGGGGVAASMMSRRGSGPARLVRVGELVELERVELELLELLERGGKSFPIRALPRVRVAGP